MAVSFSTSGRSGIRTPVRLIGAYTVSDRAPRAPDTFHERRADDSNATPGSAHSLAARPRTLPGSLSLVPSPGFEPGTSAV